MNYHDWPLPPKRWEMADDTSFDPIRNRKWFARLLKRKWQIPFLETCHKMMLDDLVRTQESICEEIKIDPRELRDFVRFKHDQTMETSENMQAALDYAYDQYCMDGAQMPWRAHIESGARAFGIKPRTLVENWEICHDFYPSQFYEKQNQGNNS